jgi:hypothetical protein
VGSGLGGEIAYSIGACRTDDHGTSETATPNDPKLLDGLLHRPLHVSVEPFEEEFAWNADAQPRHGSVAD